MIAFLTFIIIFLLLFDVVIILPYKQDIWEKISKKVFPICYWDSSSSQQEIEKSIIDYALKDNKSCMLLDEHKGLIDDVRLFWLQERRQSDIVNNFYQSYYYVGLSYYAIREGRKELIEFLIRKADSFLDDNKLSLNYKISLLDQYSIGLFYLNMYKLTRNITYKRISCNLYQELISRRNHDGLIPYLSDSKFHYVDELGMFVPFLMEFYNETEDPLAISIVNDNIANFQKLGTDSKSHIPFHGYEAETDIKLGSSNWGRGIGWYLFALSFCPQFNNPTLTQNIEKLPYTQFPLCNSVFDSSTALMFEIYKQSKSPDRILNLDFIKSHIRKCGLVDSFSGDTYNFNDYSHKVGPSELGNGLFLILISKFRNE